MKTTLLASIVVIVAAAAVVASPALADSGLVGYVPGQLMVTIAPDVTPTVDKAMGATGVPAVDALGRQLGMHKVELLYAGMGGATADKASQSLLDRVLTIDLAEGTDLLAAQAAYERLPEVASAHRVGIFRIRDAYTPNDPGLPSQYHLRNTAYGPDVRAVGAWSHTLGDSNVIVAVIDTGVDWNHPDLGGPHPDKVNGNIWTNWAEYEGSPGVDDDNNGFVDDIRGWDWVNVGDQGHPGQDDTFADNDPSDYAGHGTNCAGCISPITDNSLGIAGLAPNCKIMALRVGFLPTGSEHGVVYMSYCSQAMVYAALNGAQVVNCSWGSSSYLESAVQICQNNNVLIVNSAGNDNSSVADFLGTRAGVLSVAATDASDVKASFSNFGTWVEISAPGTGIYTTAYNKDTGASTYAYVQGTSFSGPIAAGGAAMVLSQNPGLTYSQVTTILQNSADDLDAANPSYIGLLGAGRLNVLKALGDNIHRVPQEFSSLYDAMNSSVDGDTIAVLGGEILSDIDDIPDGVKVFGGYGADYLSRDPGGNPSVIAGASYRSAVSFLGGAGPTTELDGFTIQDGGGAVQYGVPFTARCGGGVTIINASPTLRNVTVTGNSVGTSSQLGAGGGIMLSNSSALLEDVTVTGNSAIYGGALYAYASTPTLVRCSFSGSSLLWDNPVYPPRGGGVHALDSDLTMVDCVITGNGEAERGGGVYIAADTGAPVLDMTGGVISDNTARDRGAGIFQSTGTATMTGVEVRDNLRSGAATFSGGGGLAFDAATVDLDSLVVTGNTAHIGAGVIFENCPDAQLAHSLLTGNTADYYGGGVTFQDCVIGGLTGNTLTANAAPGAGSGGVYIANSDVTMASTIIAFNTGGPSLGNGIGLASGTATVTCSDVFGNDIADWSGMVDPTGTGGNIAADPMFCDGPDGIYNIGISSPCAPAQSGCGLMGVFAPGCGLSGVPGDDGSVPMVFRVEQNFPNPFNPRTTIRFVLPTAGRAAITVFDVRGRRVATLLDEDLPAARHEVTWDGRDSRDRAVSAGVYFYRVESGGHRSVGRMALIK